MKRFLKAVLLFLIPIALIYSLCFAALIKSGELQDLQTAVDISANANVCYGLAYRNDVESYKLAITAHKSPKLLVLGTSRSMQIGQELFTQSSFYNAGGAAPQIAYFLHFLKSLPSTALPEKLIIVLDQNFFNYEWDNHTTIPIYAENKILPIPFLQRFVQDIAKGKIDFAKIFTAPSNTLGLAAIINDSGYEYDGSYAYGTTADNPKQNTDIDFRDTLDKISIGKDRFAYGDTVCTICIQELSSLINYCSEKNIQLVGILPPYAPTVWQQMQNVGKYTYIEQLYPTLAPLFEQYRFELYDYSSLPNLIDAEFVDGYHGNDQTYSKIISDIAKKTDILLPEIS